MTGVIKDVAARLNVDVHRYDLSHRARRRAAMADAGVDLVLDVGANAGQYARALRRDGYQGWIISFEPIPGVFKDLCQNLRSDDHWRGYALAVAGQEGTATLNVSADTVTSSLHAAERPLLRRIPQARAVETIEVRTVPLATVWEAVPEHKAAMLKVDVQGAEHEVLDGADGVLGQVSLLELEMGLVRLYRDGSTIYDLLPRVHAAGFEVVSFGDGFVDRTTGQVLDIDVLLRRSPESLDGVHHRPATRTGREAAPGCSESSGF